MDNSAAIQSRIIRTLEIEGPKPRSYLEAVAVYEDGVEPHEVTHALRLLREAKALLAVPIEVEGATLPSHVYSLAELSHSQYSELTSLFIAHRETFEPSELGHSGEAYVRSLAYRSGCYNRIPQTRRLGHLEIGNGRYAVDLMMTRKTTDQHQVPRVVVVEVKNRRSWCYSSFSTYPVLIKNALHVGAVPMLCVSHAPSEAVAFCKGVGIALLTMDRQLVLKSRRRQVEALRSIIGPRPIEYVARGRFYQNSTLPEEAKSDLVTIASENWIDEAANTWRANRGVIASSIQRDWKVTRRMLCSRLDISVG